MLILFQLYKTHKLCYKDKLNNHASYTAHMLTFIEYIWEEFYLCYAFDIGIVQS